MIGFGPKGCASIGGTMKIQQVETRLVRLPVEEPLVGAPPYPAMMREFLTVRVLTDDGIEGIGITAFGGKLMRALKAAVEEWGRGVMQGRGAGER